LENILKQVLILRREIREEIQVPWNQVNIQISELNSALEKASILLMAKYNHEIFNEDKVLCVLGMI